MMRSRDTDGPSAAPEVIPLGESGFGSGRLISSAKT